MDDMYAQPSEETRHLSIEFFDKEQKNAQKSAEEGRPIFDNVEMVKIRFAGEKGTELVAPAHTPSAKGPDGEWMSYAERFPRHYHAFKSDQHMTVEGTPLTEATFLDAGQRASLRAVNVHTMEQLAGLEGKALSAAGMGTRKLKEMAEDYLARAKDGAQSSRLASENEALRNRLDALQDQLDALTSGETEKPAKRSAEAEVIEEGPFEGFDKARLREYITDNGGGPLAPGFKLATLHDMALEIAQTVGKAA